MVRREQILTIESPLFKTFYAARQKQEQAKQILFHSLSSIFGAPLPWSLGLLGGWLSLPKQIPQRL